MPKPTPQNNPICFAQPRRLAVSAWVEHVPFAMYLVDALRPTSIVELGTRNGVSYCAFCQAVETSRIDAACTAVDSWHGDAHTGAYGPGVLEDLRQHHDPLYGSFSRLMQTTFDEAAADVPDASIDLLHIDGFHSYDAARHDLETWLPKVSRRGVILLHDIAERGRGFGVWKLWAELSGRYPSFAFHHGHGLGVLGIGPEIPDSVSGLLHLGESDAAEIRSFFLRRGRSVAFRTMRQYAAALPARLVIAAVELTRKLGAVRASSG